MINNVLKKIYLILSVLLFIYTAVCATWMTFSISVTFYFIAMAFLLFMLFYKLQFPINKEERGPSFFYVFIDIASVMLFSATIFILLFNITYPKQKLPENKNYDYIIVFGAGVNPERNEIMNSRIDKAVEYAKKYKNCRFVLTGAKGKGEPIEEAYYMKNYMNNYGIDDDRIIVEPFSVNTYENILNSLELIRIDALKRNRKENIITRPFNNKKGIFDMDFLNIGFMSSEFHLTRIDLMAKKHGVRVPYDIYCNTKPLYVVYMYIRENLSMFKAFVLGQIMM